uniref:PH domain-containing protein n=1 Tax=Alexandrium catenella TaxID=2925 RepID=A0A7S1WIJ9_ALECA
MEPDPQKKGQQEEWKVPIWQEPVREAKVELAKHEDGPLIYAKREGFLQKRAGKSRFRWNVRYFELRECKLRWWRPKFSEQLFQPRMPSVAKADSRRDPVRCLDLTQLATITRTKVKFPYSTRLLLRFKESYTDYELEIRAEKEAEIIGWFKVLVRFTMEVVEEEKAKEEEEDTQAGTEDRGAASDTDGGP